MSVTLLHRFAWRVAWRCVGAAIGVAGFSLHGRAESSLERRGFFSETIGAFKTTLRHGQWDAYVSGYAWHMPWAYDETKRGELNETTWGGGFGRSLTLEEGRVRHSVFVMGFADSHRDAQFIAAYNWQRYVALNRDLGLGLGYMAFLFSRKDVASYLPIPAALPCASIRFRRWEAVGLYVPRVSKEITGDVFYVFLRVGLLSGRRKSRLEGRAGPLGPPRLPCSFAFPSGAPSGRALPF